ncbi:MAG: hypothetical protein ACOC2C_02445 [Cyclonatronaceae bacterium]
MPNKYVKRSRISEAKFRELIRYFCLDLTAVQITELSGLNRNTVNRYLCEVRGKIVRYCEHVSTLPTQIDCKDEHSERCVRGILIKEQQGRMFTGLVMLSHELMAEEGWLEELKARIKEFSQYDMLIVPSTNTQLMLHADAVPRAQLRGKMNRIKSFWGSTKARLSKFKGLRRSTYELHLKECEFRYNNRGNELYPLVLKILRRDPIE